MKFLALAINFFLAANAYANDNNVLAGTYAGCSASMLSTTDKNVSNFYEFIFREDSSIDLRVKTYSGTDNCDNTPVGGVEYKNFRFASDSGNFSGRVIVAQEIATRVFFKFVIAKSYVALDSFSHFPISENILDVGVINRIR